MCHLVVCQEAPFPSSTQSVVKSTGMFYSKESCGGKLLTLVTQKNTCLTAQISKIILQYAHENEQLPLLIGSSDEHSKCSGFAC